MDIQTLLKEINGNFYTGVPDSQLKALCSCLADTFGISRQHIIAANEGNCTAIAAGYYLATGKIPIVYMQNSGIGNIINPVVSLLNNQVYGIPCIFVIGWRGEPGVHDEPQHIFQGQITEKLLKDIDIFPIIIGPETPEESLKQDLDQAKKLLDEGKSIACLVRKNTFSYEKKTKFANANKIIRESAIEEIVKVSQEDIIVSTTGKASRELFEIREKNNQSHKYDFLTVGSMGHSSSIALGIALNKPNTKVWCLDGDGAVFMHMGALAIIGSLAPENLIHVVLNNEAHETVGGMPTVAADIDLLKIAEGCGYSYTASVKEYFQLRTELQNVRQRQKLSFIEIKCAIGSRADLGRPTTTAIENKELFMKYLRTLK